MIPKSLPLRRRGWTPVFGKGLPPRTRGSCSTNNAEWDDDSKISHPALMGAEERSAHPIAGRDAELLGGAADHLERRAHRPAGGDVALRQRLGVLGDAQDAAVGANEEHVERDEGVLHPERDRLIEPEIEQHTVALRQLAPEHQAVLLFLRRDRQLDLEGMDAALAGDLDRLQLGGAKAIVRR